VSASLAAALAALVAGGPVSVAQASPASAAVAPPPAPAPDAAPGPPAAAPAATPAAATSPPADPSAPAPALPATSTPGLAPASPGSAGAAPAASAPALPTAPSPAAAAGGRPCRPELFRIRRSTNANEIVYAAQLDEAGRLDEDDPLVAYWLMHAEDGHREGLNILEKMLAYGFSAEPAPEGGFHVVLKAKKDRPVHLALRNGCPVAFIEIAGQPALLRSIFVQTSSGGVIPTVAHVDLTGVDPASGRDVSERILPN
jgi:hypothetical protein